MTTWSCRIATTPQHLEDARHVRSAVLAPEPAATEGEFPSHVVVHAGPMPVATARLVCPVPEGTLARAPRLARCEGFCILDAWRYSEALAWLMAGLYWESRARGVTHWLVSVTTETDVLEDARLVFQVAEHRRWVSPRWRTPTLASLAPPRPPTARLYSDLERAAARRGHVEGLRLPGVLCFLARNMGARLISEPHYEPAVQRFFLTLVAVLEELPARTARHFEALRLRAAHGR